MGNSASGGRGFYPSKAAGPGEGTSTSVQTRSSGGGVLPTFNFNLSPPVYSPQNIADYVPPPFPKQPDFVPAAYNENIERKYREKAIRGPQAMLQQAIREAVQRIAGGVNSNPILAKYAMGSAYKQFGNEMVRASGEALKYGTGMAQEERRVENQGKVLSYEASQRGAEAGYQAQVQAGLAGYQVKAQNAREGGLQNFLAQMGNYEAKRGVALSIFNNAMSAYNRA
jgi:hypothetical protein